MNRIHSVTQYIKYCFVPKPHIVGLGRWNSSIKENKQFTNTFHDLCNHDNCYMHKFTLQNRVKEFVKSPDKNKYSGSDVVLIIKSSKLLC
jgi:hypothetical protein